MPVPSRMLSFCYPPPFSPGSRPPIILLISADAYSSDTKVALLSLSFLSCLLPSAPLASLWNRGPLRFTRTPRRIVVDYLRSSFDDRYTRSITWRPASFCLDCFRILSYFLISETEARLLVDVLSEARVALVCCIT